MTKPPPPPHAKAVNKDSPTTLRSGEFFLVGDPLPTRDEWDPKPPARGKIAWTVTGVATTIAVISVVLFAYERTTHVEEIGRREVRIAELEANGATMADRLATFEADKVRLVKDAALKETELKARAKVVVDALTASLRDEAARGDAKIETLEDGRVVVELSDRLLFPDEASVVGAAGQEALVRLGAVLAGLNDRTFEIVGHSDTKKPKGYDAMGFWELSSMRASRVLIVLEEQAKVSPKRLTASGRGVIERKGNRSRNRRVEIVLSP